MRCPSCRQMPLSFTCFSSQAFNALDDAHPQWGGPSAYSESINLNANLPQRHPHRHTPKYYLIRALNHQPNLPLINHCRSEH